MRLIVGLGNPGKRYEWTRHNIGFQVADALCSHWQTEMISFDPECKLFYCREKKTWILKPMTYMNLSGKAIIKVLNFYKISTQNMLVIQDDLDLKLGDIRIRQQGSSGGHNGIRSIEEYVQKPYTRFRIGIDHPRRLGLPMEVADFVLSPFSASERAVFTRTLPLLIRCIELCLEDKIELAMNHYYQQLNKE